MHSRARTSTCSALISPLVTCRYEIRANKKRPENFSFIPRLILFFNSIEYNQQMHGSLAFFVFATSQRLSFEFSNPSFAQFVLENSILT